MSAAVAGFNVGPSLSIFSTSANRNGPRSDGVADNRDDVGSCKLAAGYHTVDIVFFENAGGASLEFYGRQGTDAIELLQSVPEPTSLTLAGLSLLALGFSQRMKA